MNNALIKSLLFWVLFDALLFGLSYLAALAPPDFSWLLQASLGILTGFLLIWLFLKREKRTFRDIGLVWDKNTLSKFLLGVLIGTGLFTLVLFALVSFTSLEFTRSSNVIKVQTWLTCLLFIIPFAFMEELAFRSYTLLKLEKVYGIWWAQLIVATAFAFYHIVSGWSWEAAFLGTFVWSFVFALGATLSRGIALPTGIHAVLNFLQILAGTKPDKASLWTVKMKPDHAINANAIADNVGMFLQILILIVAIAGTYVFVWKKKPNMVTIGEKS